MAYMAHVAAIRPGPLLTRSSVVIELDYEEAPKQLPHLLLREVVVWHVSVNGINVHLGARLDFVPGQGLRVFGGGHCEKQSASSPQHPVNLRNRPLYRGQSSMLDHRMAEDAIDALVSVGE